MIPDAIAAEYEAALLAHIARRWATLLRALPAELRPEAPEGTHADATPSALSLVAVLDGLFRLARRWGGQTADASKLARVGRAVEGVAAASVGGAFERAGVEPPAGRVVEAAQSARVKAWATENAALIQSLDARMVGDVVRLVTRAAEDGTATRTLAAQIAERAEVSRSRAKVIARDQVGKLMSRASQERARAAGAGSYRWSSSKDERVRPEHAARDGKVFRWDDPPPGGHPGTEVLCRCVAVPIFDL